MAVSACGSHSVCEIAGEMGLLKDLGGLQWESVWHIGLCYTWIALFAFPNMNHGWTVYFLLTCFLLQTWSVYTGWPKNVIRSPLSIYSPNINRFKEFFSLACGLNFWGHPVGKRDLVAKIFELEDERRLRKNVSCSKYCYTLRYKS